MNLRIAVRKGPPCNVESKISDIDSYACKKCSEEKVTYIDRLKDIFTDWLNAGDFHRTYLHCEGFLDTLNISPVRCKKINTCGYDM
jgi:hypothetical protein